MSTGTTKTTDGRADTLKAWERETDDARRLGRRFAGERLKGANKPEWLAKAGFVLGTAAVVFFVFAHGGKDERAHKREARAAEQADEPSVRDFRPPVMPMRTAAVQPEPPKQVEKRAPKAIDDSSAAADRRKAAQLEEARTKSDILVKSTGAVSASTAVSGAASPAIAPPVMAMLPRAAGPAERPGDPNRAFASQVSGKRVVTAHPKAVGDLRCVALQGRLIDAELETAINTDLPGQIRAVVSAPLYAEQGREALVPAGSRLNGIYNSAVRKGQVRVFAIWNRLIRPDGIEIALDSAATDALGRAGMAGETDNHFVQIFGMSALLSIIGAGAGTAGVSPDARYNSADAYRYEVQQSFGRSADRVLEPYANIPPTNTIAQGERVTVLLNRDLNFCSLKAASQERLELVLP